MFDCILNALLLNKKKRKLSLSSSQSIEFLSISCFRYTKKYQIHLIDVNLGFIGSASEFKEFLGTQIDTFLEGFIIIGKMCKSQILNLHCMSKYGSNPNIEGISMGSGRKCSIFVKNSSSMKSYP